MMLLWLLVPAGILIWLMSRPEMRGGSGREDQEDPLEILRRRYARGEITREEFERMKQDLA